MLRASASADAPPSLTPSLPVTVQATTVPAYPEAYVDRPIILFPGMTQLEVDEQARSTTTATLSNTTPDVYVRHSVGSIELAADLGYDAVVQASFDTRSEIGVFVVRAVSGAPQIDHSLHEAQAAELQQKWHLVPGRLAAFVELGVSLSENRLPLQSGTLTWSHAVDSFVVGQAQLQVTSKLAVLLGAEYDHPSDQSASPHFVSSADALTSLVLALGSWDLYANFNVDDLGDQRLLYLEAGFANVGAAESGGTAWLFAHRSRRSRRCGSRRAHMKCAAVMWGKRQVLHDVVNA